MACIAPVPSAMIEDTKSKVDTGLFTRPRTGHSRTLYSFRHIYAIFARINDSKDSHTLAIQMGTIIFMVERHYSHYYVTPPSIFKGRKSALSSASGSGAQRSSLSHLWIKNCIHPLPTGDLRHRHPRHPRLPTNRTLFIIRAKLLLLPLFPAIEYLKMSTNDGEHYQAFKRSFRGGRPDGYALT